MSVDLLKIQQEYLKYKLNHINIDEIYCELIYRIM